MKLQGVYKLKFNIYFLILLCCSKSNPTVLFRLLYVVLCQNKTWTKFSYIDI